jgi:nucleotide-binding universal stress UspA family protein
MFEKIMVPVDLSHIDKLSRALGVAAELAKSHSSEIAYVGVYGNLRTPAAHNPDEYREKLAKFAQEQSQEYGIKTSSVPLFSHDPEVELDSVLLKAISETGSDAVVMASHEPGWVERIFHSNAGYIASHAKVSVFVVR